MKILNAYAGIGGKDLFTQDVSGRLAIHVATNTPIILLRSAWYKGMLSYDVLVPIMDDKKLSMCNATYSDEEIEIKQGVLF